MVRVRAGVRARTRVWVRARVMVRGRLRARVAVRDNDHVLPGRNECREACLRAGALS